MQANVSARHPVEWLEPDGLHTKWQTMTEERASSCNQTPKPAQMATEARIIRESFGKHQLGAHCITKQKVLADSPGSNFFFF